MSDQLQLLQKIADNTAQSDSMTIAVVAACAGIFGAGLTVLGNYVMARMTRQIEEKRLRASIVTAERLRWLQDVRQRLARFYVQLDMQYNYITTRPVPTTPEEKIEFQKQLDVFSSEVNEQCNIITLMMNPEKPEQSNLKTTLQNALIFVSQCIQIRNTFVSGKAGAILPLSPSQIPFNNQEYSKIKTEAFDSLTKIGVKTWGQIRDLD